jgi:hypothetical protein
MTQQQHWQSGGQPPRYDFDSYRRQGSPALPVMSAILGLGIAGALTWQDLELLDLAGDSFNWPGGWTAMVIGTFVVAGIALIGAVLVFAKQLAGAVVLFTGALCAVAGMLTVPFFATDVGFTLTNSLSDIGTASSVNDLYFKQLFDFEFDNTQAALRLVALVLGVLLLIVALLPPSLRWLRKPRRDDYSAQQTGW